ncbi:hypothetical protein [Streptomyces bugieae]|uniref:HNH endonuclease n=1 Tax=Streptomyces bugieae TaxID=3098223 RepID=A0ABU7NL24_9ACTN|nr:hypothetical protein [Streptomyces sp. DSM 41528]
MSGDIMLQTGYVYVPRDSATNLEIGLNNSLWGWRDSALDRAGARNDVKRLQKGDLLVLGHRGPNSRVKPGGWASASLQRVIVAQVTRPYFMDRSRVWPDDEYPARIGISVLDDEDDVDGTVLGPNAMESLRLSANKQGVAVPVLGLEGVARLASQFPAPETDATVDHEGELNAVANVLVRREQSKLRRQLLGRAENFTCALCGRTLPTRMIRAAHIKRRSVATREEQLTLANLMPACTLGCDELFEHGFIRVNAEGIIESGRHGSLTDDLGAAVADLAGRQIHGYTSAKAPFYAWHRENIAS